MREKEQKKKYEEVERQFLSVKKIFVIDKLMLMCVIKNNYIKICR